MRFLDAFDTASKILSSEAHVGKKLQPTHLFGFRLECVVPVTRYIAKLMQGDLEPVELRQAMQSALQNAPKCDQGTCRALCRAFEGAAGPQIHLIHEWESWECLESVNTTFEWSAAAHFGNMLAKAQRALSCCKCAKTGEINARTVQEGLSAWQCLTCRAIRESLNTPLKLELFTVTRNCIFEGCRVMFEMPQDKVKCSWCPSDTACTTHMKHMEDTVYCLSRCLSAYSSDKLKYRRQQLFPLGHEYAKAMLTWFKLWLRDTGSATSSTESTWRAANKQPDGGYVDVFNRLLDIQGTCLTSSDIPELMTACMPATVALVRLLNGEGIPNATCGSKKGIGFTRGGIQLSLLVRLTPVGLSEQEGLPDVRVEVGSHEAKQIGIRHLDHVLSLLSKQGKPLCIHAIDGPHDLGGSFMAWETVWLRKLLIEQMNFRRFQSSG
mmetsp:Transcript_36472/g.86607  ORF Transcript_36472/g.86607 Transcript_36472/m.86607 type:complete len:438 (+) Transcript_36472:252-1565(+)